MAQRKPIVIDGLVTEVLDKATLADIVPRDVTSVFTQDGQLVQRDQFRRVPVPDGFETNLSPINKGAPSSPNQRKVS